MKSMEETNSEVQGEGTGGLQFKKTPEEGKKKKRSDGLAKGVWTKKKAGCRGIGKSRSGKPRELRQ